MNKGDVMKTVVNWGLILVGVIVGAYVVPGASAHTPETLSGPTYCYVHQVVVPQMYLNEGFSESAIVLPAGFWSEGWNPHYVGSRFLLVGMICTSQDSPPVK